MHAANLGNSVSTGSGYQVVPLRSEFFGMINYSYIVVDLHSGEAAIVDPAWDLGQILGKLEELGADLTTILLTHSHPDHVNLVPALLRSFAPRVVMSGPEAEFYAYSCRNLRPVRHLERLTLGDTSITCLLTPGHTAGGMCYLLSDTIFTGDTVFIEGCGLCSLPGGSAAQMYESIRMLSRTVSGQVRVYPGHCYGGPPGLPLDQVKKENIYFQLDRKDIFIDFRMRKGQRNLFNFR